jgi:hypothetical protein
MTLRHYFDSGRFLKNGKGGLSEIALLFSRLGFRFALGFWHGETVPQVNAERNC